jgi:hypothetical protein
MLFNIFINDLVEALRDTGVTVQGIEGEIGSLLFANDLAILAPDEETLEQALAVLEK